jgi:hypothetical protein
MEVANVVRERTAIEQTVAAAEEKIKDVRMLSEAERERQSRVIDAEGEAQEKLVHSVKEAEARAQSAAHHAKEMTTLAEAELAAASKKADAQRTLAEGTKAERAAPGLADAQVKEALAAALEKTGVAEANVAAAKGTAEANVTAAKGTAEANALAARLLAEAEGKSKLGEAEAAATRALGSAEAQNINDRLGAEAEGLAKKFEAMDTMSDEVRRHDELRLQMENSLTQSLAAIDAGKVIAQENAKVMASAVGNAKIEVIGGDTGVFENMTKGISLAKAIEGLAQNSPLVQQVVGAVAAKVAGAGNSQE